MPIIRCQVTVPATSANSEDAVTNTWHFTTTDVTEGTLTLVKAALVTFYEAMDSYKGDLQNWAGARIKIFNLEDAEPRQPIDDVGLALTSAPLSDSLPHELASCLSFNGDYVSGFPQSRRRGRIYFGPVNGTVLDYATGLLSTAFITALKNAGAGLLTASNAASDWAWVVYSPTGDTGYLVTEGWVDNAPDIQRRRGFRSTARQTF